LTQRIDGGEGSAGSCCLKPPGNILSNDPRPSWIVLPTINEWIVLNPLQITLHPGMSPAYFSAERPYTSPMGIELNDGDPFFCCQSSSYHDLGTFMKFQLTWINFMT